MNENSPVTQGDLAAMTEIMEQMRELFEERIESNEKILASLTSAFVEVSSAVEAIAEKVMEPGTEEEKAAFRSEIRRRHHEQLQMMEKIGRDMERSNTSDPSSSVLKMAGRYASNAQRESDGDSGVPDQNPATDVSDS